MPFLWKELFNAYGTANGSQQLGSREPHQQSRGLLTEIWGFDSSAAFLNFSVSNQNSRFSFFSSATSLTSLYCSSGLLYYLLFYLSEVSNYLSFLRARLYLLEF